ncbi:MAG: hypothetical protein WAO91_08055 [Candidatus Nitrosotenuis sp.]
MNALDVLLHKAMLQTIQNEIDMERFQHIKKRLQNQGIVVSDLINRFDEVRGPLSGFEEELKRVEDKVFKEFLVVESTDNETWLTIKNRYLTESIIKTFADEDKKLILDLTSAKAETIPKTLVLCKIPNTSGYRKMRQLIDDGFVTPTGLVETFEGRRTMLYRTIIEGIQIIINKSDVSTKIAVPKEILGSSVLIRTIIEVGQGKRKVSN